MFWRFKYQTVATVHCRTTRFSGCKYEHLFVLQENGWGKRRMKTISGHYWSAKNHHQYFFCKAWEQGGQLPELADLISKPRTADLHVIHGGAA